MRSFRVLLASVAFLGLSGFQDPANQYTIDFPEGWKQMDVADNPGGFTFVQAPDGLTSCSAKSAPLPQIAALTQEQINTELANPFDAAGWAGVLGTPPTNLTLDKAEVRDIEGKVMQIATVTLAPGFEEIPFETKARLAFIMVPGKVVLGTCLTTPDKYGEYEQTFEATVGSIRPL